MAAAVIGAPILVYSAMPHGPLHAIGAGVFAISLVILYLASTLYHGIPEGRAKRRFRVLDHNAIFLLIAGSYTPFALGVLNGPRGWLVFGLVWGIALGGFVLKSTGRLTNRLASIGLYVGMGWLMVLAIEPHWQELPYWGLFWLIAGGVIYTGGVVFYVAQQIRYGHVAWHICVMAGSACHFTAVLRYAV